MLHFFQFPVFRNYSGLLSFRVLNIELANDSSVFLLFHYVTVRNFFFEIPITFLVKLFLISIIVEYCPCFPSVDLLASFS
jgi:hypothetical protein